MSLTNTDLIAGSTKVGQCSDFWMFNEILADDAAAFFSLLSTAMQCSAVQVVALPAICLWLYICLSMQWVENDWT